MNASTNPSLEDMSASQQIDAIISASDDWRGKKLAQLRVVILQAHSAVVEEVKWKKPSKPEGVAVWSYNGIICHADILKNAVRLTFHKGPFINDPENLFNTRLDSNSVRAIDFHEADAINEAALQALIREGVELNASKVRKR